MFVILRRITHHVTYFYDDKYVAKQLSFSVNVAALVNLIYINISWQPLCHKQKAIVFIVADSILEGRGSRVVGYINCRGRKMGECEHRTFSEGFFFTKKCQEVHKRSGTDPLLICLT